MKNIILLGYGHIGQAIAHYFNEIAPYDYKISVIDPSFTRYIGNIIGHKCSYTDFLLKHNINQYDAIINTLPVSSQYDAGIKILSKNSGIAYFDITEDVNVTSGLKRLVSTDYRNNTLIGQCGLAPGIVSSIATTFIKQSLNTRALKIRVGAIPLEPDENYNYCFTWSPEGVVNEYLKNSIILKDGQVKVVPSLTGYELIKFKDETYEAFYTSGGVGSLVQYFKKDKNIKNIDYKSIRHRGHLVKVKSLLKDLEFYTLEDTVKEFKKKIPVTKRDKVLISVSGWSSPLKKTFEYNKTIKCDDNNTAIQKTTALSLCAIVDLYFNNKLPQTSIILQEDINFNMIQHNRFGLIY